MDKEKHKQRHIELHKAFDELLADFISDNKTMHMSETTLKELMEWSYKQTLEPNHNQL